MQNKEMFSSPSEMIQESLKYLDEFPIIVGKIISCNEFHVIPILKDHIPAQDEFSKYFRKADFKKLDSKTNPVEDVHYLSKHSHKRLVTRVMALKVYAEGYLDVFNIDDSTFETVETAGIGIFPIPMQKLNLNTIVVKLFNIECCNEKCKDSKVVLNRISELMHHKRLYAVIRQFVNDEPLVDIYDENITNLVYQELIDEGLFIRTNEALVKQLSTSPTEIEKYDIMEHHDQEFSCLFKCMKENSTNAIIFPLIEDHVDSMRKMEAALDSLVFHDLYKITEPLLNKLCIVYSVESRKRFRAKILSEKHKQSYVKIHYIDENTTNTVSMAYIRQIPPDLMFYKTKHVEVSLHNLSFKKGFEKEMTKDLVSTMENKTMDVLIRAFDDEGIPIVDLYKNNVPILVYQEILEKFTPTQLTEDHLEKQDAVSVDQMISLKKTSSVESFEEEFLCTFSYVVDPYNIAVYPIIDTGAFIPEKIRTTSRGLVNSAYLERVKNPELNKRCFLCLPQNENCYLSLIVRCNYNKTCLKIRLLEFNTCLYVNVLYLYEIPDLQIESIVVTLNFKFDPKFDAIISSELNYILKDKRLNVVVRQSEPDRLLVVDMYEVGSSILVYQKLIDMLTTASQYKEEIKQNRSIISGNHKIKEEELKLKQNLDLDEDNLMTFDDIPADQTFNKQIMKRILLNDVDFVLKPLSVGVFACILVDFITINNFQLLPLINTHLSDIEPLEVQVEKFQEQKLTVQLYKVKINKDIDATKLNYKFCLLIGDQTLIAVVRDSDVNGVPFVELYGKNPFILAYQDFIDDGSFIVTDNDAKHDNCYD